MTTGALIFAFNNERTDYVAMAAWNARRIKKFLSLPVAVITDCQDQDRLVDFDQVISAPAESGGSRYFEDYKDTVTWHNASRTDAWTLTPWDHTLLLDADYVVDSNNLQVVLDSPEDFLCFRGSYDLASPTDKKLLPTFGKVNFPMWWATVISFRKTEFSQYVFDTMDMIKQNWSHYCNIYGMEKGTYRNDHALSIALALVSGHSLRIKDIPWNMPSILPEDDLTKQGEHWLVNYQDSNSKRRQFSMRGMDFHAMGKHHLERIIADQG